MQPSSASRSDTLPLSVRNTGFLLDRLGQDCHPLQFLRELTQNAIEAILRTPGKSGEIVWDAEWNAYELAPEKPLKLCVIDNGDGMTGEELVHYINQLSSSLTEQSIGGNYGVGAKIAAATRNHYGLFYFSWKDGRGSLIHLWRDPTTQQYGLKQLERPDGTYGHFAAVDDALKPGLIGDHGTMIVLMGHSEGANTVKAPEGASSPSRWVAKYLNSRYFALPPKITVKAREGWEYPRSDTDRNVLRAIVGQREYLAQHAASTGKQALSGAVVHWWILKDEPALTNNSGFIESAGHIAALHDSELFELSTARAGRARLQQFGILFGHQRVVLYVQPKPGASDRVITNTARTQLLINGEPLPWADWAAEFRENIPSEIITLMEAVSAASEGTDHSKSIRERLKQIMDLYRVSRYRASSTGAFMISDESAVGGSTDAVNPTPTKKRGRQSQGGDGGAGGNLYTLFLKSDGEPGHSVRAELFPETSWITTKNGTRNPGDIEDRAARYLRAQNVLLINQDFRVFQDMVSHWLKYFGERQAGVASVIEDAVHNWFEQSLVETVIGVLALKDSKEWSLEDIDKALSEEALTAAVAQRYHVLNSIKRELGAKLGKLQTGTDPS